MRRFFFEKINIKNGYSAISGPEVQHIKKVLRMGKGDRFILMDGKGSRFQALIESLESGKLHIKLEKELPAPAESPIEIILCQSMLKSNSMDYLIQKTSELGVNRIIPFFSKRTVVKLEGARADNKIRHWKRIAQSSAKQADRFTPATVDAPIEFFQMIDGFKNTDTLKIIMWEQETSNNLKGVLQKNNNTKKIICIVGSEGGFTAEEINYAASVGFISISLGNRILRAETAAITITAILQYEFGNLSMPVNTHPLFHRINK